MAKEKPLTLEELAKYNQEIMFPFMKENFVNKKEFKELKNDLVSFKDSALKDLGDLKQEKTIGDEQDKRKTKVLEIHNNALKSKKDFVG
jgi:hypothetical protein